MTDSNIFRSNIILWYNHQAYRKVRGYMGLFKLFHKKEKPKSQLTTLQVGDWVTQYSSGYWKVIKIFPKYADEDYCSGNKSWKKGDRLGDWVILKKGFTSSMKPSNGCEFVDAQWCKAVSDDVVHSLESILDENPKAKQKFENAPSMPKPSVNSVWLTLSEEQAEVFSKSFELLPHRFTLEQFWKLSSNYRQHIVDPSNATHILYLFSYLWEIDDHFQPLHFDPQIKKL